MNEFFLLVAVFSTFRIIQRTGILSPASVSALFTTVSMAIFYFISIASSSVILSSQGLSFQLGDYSQSATIVLLFYSGFVVVTLLSVPKIDNTAGKFSSLYERRVTLQNRLFSSSVIPLIASILFALSVYHGILVYALKDEGEAFINAVTQASGIICVITSCLIISYRGINAIPWKILLAVVFVYHNLVLLAQFSRWIALYWMIIMLLIASKRLDSKRSPLSPSIVFAAAMSITMFLYALQGRVDRSTVFSLDVILPHLADVHFESVSLYTVLLNIFQGPIILAEALRVSPVEYNFSYKALSFSPFPSGIDGWKDILPLQVRINKHTPFNTFAELYNFGPFFLSCFIVVYFICMRTMTKIYRQVGPFLGFLIASPCIYSLAAFHQYPLRNSFRLLIFSTLFAYLVFRFFENRKEAEVPLESAPDNYALGQYAIGN